MKEALLKPLSLTKKNHLENCAILKNMKSVTHHYTWLSNRYSILIGVKIEREFECSCQDKNIDSPGMWAWEMCFCPVCSIKALAESIGCLNIRGKRSKSNAEGVWEIQEISCQEIYGFPQQFKKRNSISIFFPTHFSCSPCLCKSMRAAKCCTKSQLK